MSNKTQIIIIGIAPMDTAELVYKSLLNIVDTDIFIIDEKNRNVHNIGAAIEDVINERFTIPPFVSQPFLVEPVIRDSIEMDIILKDNKPFYHDLNPKSRSKYSRKRY